MSTKNTKLLIQVRADIQKAVLDLQKVTTEVGKTGEAGKKASKGMSGMSTQMGFLTKAVGAYLTLGFAVKLLKDADAFNQLQVRIKTATKNTDDYTKVSQELYKISQQNGTQLRTTVSLFQNLARTAPELQATNTEMLELTKTVQQLGIISGSTQEQQNNALLQFSQAMAGGVFRAEEFNSIIENMPELAARIATGLGKTVGQLRLSVIEGNLLSKDVFYTLLKQSPEIAQEFKEIPISLNRSTTQLATSTARFLSMLDKATGLTDSIGEKLRNLSGYLDALSAENGSLEALEYEKKRLEIQIEFQNRVSETAPRALFLRESLAKVTEEIKRANQEAKDLNKAVGGTQTETIDPNLSENLQKIKDKVNPLSKEMRELKANITTVSKALDSGIIQLPEYLNLITGLQSKTSAAKEAAKSQALALKEQQQAQESAAEAIKIEAEAITDLVDRLDPSSKATENLFIDLERLDQLFLNGNVSGERYDQLTYSLLGGKQATQEMVEELDVMDRALDLIIQDFAKLDEAEAKQIAGLTDLGKTGSDAMKQLEAATKGWGDQFTNGLADMVQSGKLDFASLADSIISDLLRIQIYQNIVKPLFGAIGVPGFGSGAGASVGSNHSGGIAGSGASRTINPALFSGAQRYHSGGIAGLRPNEVPAILEQGEEVLTSKDPRHRNNQSGGMNVTIMVENKGNPIKASSAQPSFDASGLVVQVFTEDLERGGAIANKFQQTYNLKR